MMISQYAPYTPSKRTHAHNSCIFMCLPAQVSPHEFMQAVILASKKRFTLDSQSDPVEFASWLLNSLHADLTGGKLKKQSIITQCFQVCVLSETGFLVCVCCLGLATCSVCVVWDVSLGLFVWDVLFGLCCLGIVT